ncbi:MAG TPA: SDR family oxidoreductase [Pseudolabrys sp.]|nr:SDR family oxidoreductase [Pseudolabrys sp.]
MAAKAVTLITGASAGIGTALAHVFAERGHALVLTARREAQLKAVADAIAVTGRARPEIIALDLGQHDGPAQLAAELARRGLEPEIVVNNAGFGLQGLSADLDRGQQLAIIDLNMRTLTDLSLRFLDSLKRARGGILNVASIAGFFPGPQMAVYHASKAYVVSFSEALHAELAADGVRVSVLCPGPVPTEFNARAGVPDDYFPRFLERSAVRVARDGYDGLMAGRRVIVPGLPNKVMTLLPRIMPRGLMLMAIDPETRII